VADVDNLDGFASHTISEDVGADRDHFARSERRHPSAMGKCGQAVRNGDQPFTDVSSGYGIEGFKIFTDSEVID
jgi:hypothetical protein